MFSIQEPLLMELIDSVNTENSFGTVSLLSNQSGCMLKNGKVH